MIEPAVGEVVRGAISGALMLPLFAIAHPLMLAWLRWSHSRIPGWLTDWLWLIELLVLGLMVVGTAIALSAHLAHALGIPGLPYDADAYRPGQRIWPADVLLHAAGAIPGLVTALVLTRLPGLRRARARWHRLVDRLSR